MIIRPATVEDVPAIVALLADDPLGSSREDPSELTPYFAAYAEIAADPQQTVAVAVDEQTHAVIGTLQLTVIPHLSRRGMRRGQLEGVRIAADRRGTGLGTQLITWAVETARAQGCGLLQLTTDQSRTQTHAFYAGLGFQQTHLGFKLDL